MLKIKRLILRNYKRIYNGLGTRCLDIDFAEAHNIFRLIGNNGTGKSTILNALTPFPEPPSEYMPNCTEAGKSIYLKEDNMMYHICYTYNGKTNSASIEKYPYGHWDIREELNPSGNISSAKEIIYSLFNLDANFETLTMMNGYDKKSLAHMKPSERKTFITSLLNNLGVYNAMYKTLCKRSSIFKAMINDIKAKIINIGNSPSAISAQITNLTNQIDELNKKREDIIKKLAVIDLSDEDIRKNERTKQEIQEINKEIQRIMNIIADLKAQWSHTISSVDYNKLHGIDIKIEHNTLNEISQIVSKIQQDVLSLKSQIELLEKEKEMLLKQRSILIDKKKFIEASSEYIEYSKFNQEFSNEGLAEANEFINSFKERYSDINDSDIFFLMNDTNLDLFITQFQRLLMEREKLSNLNFNVNNVNTHGVMDQEYNYEQDQVLSYKRTLYHNLTENKDVNRSIVKLEDIDLAIMNVNLLRKRKDIDYSLYDLVHDFNLNEKILGILGIKFVYNKNKNIVYIGKFDYDRARSFNDSVIMYSNFKEFVDKYKTYLHGNLANKVTEFINQLNEIKEEFININDRVETIINTVKDYRVQLELLNNNIVCFGQLKNIIYKYEAYTKKVEDLEVQRKLLEASYVDTSDCTYYKNELNEVDRLIKQSQDALYRYRYSLDLINEYVLELDDFKDKHQYVETIKKYCSPNTGIQIIFIDLYMNQILKTANYILKHLFGGEFILQNFVINENEFRIPVQGDGLLIDDISSMSASQIAMINMAVSFAILENTSSKYKIIRLDEIDSPLDTLNRAAYPQIVSMVMNILGSSQCFLVSHNEEFNSEEFKTINLQKGVSKYDDQSN